MPRFVDALLSAVLLAVFSPVLLVTAAAVRWNLGSPILFRQTRIGRGGRPFEMVKFRTMRDALDAEGRPLPDAQRLTSLGKFLRATSLDELPELVNVLRGEMALVGPRPLLPDYLPLYTPEQARRHDVRPGVTGWAQVNGRNALSWPDKFSLDRWYVEHRSFGLDLRILGLTVARVLLPSGISQEGHATAARFDETTSDRCVVFGAGGHAKVVISTLRRRGFFVEAIYDDDPKHHGRTVHGVPVVGDTSDYASGPRRRGLIAIGSNAVRRKFAEQLDCEWITAVDPAAHVDTSATLAPGCYIAAGAVIQPDAVIGAHAIINTTATVDHDTHVGAYSHIAPGANLAGSARVGEGVLCGIGSAIIPRVTIGDGVILGAGAVALQDIPAGATAVGVPAVVRSPAIRLRAA